MSVIYKITNKINDKTYIGKTKQKNYIKYIEGHFKLAKKNDDNKYFYNAIRKYGLNNFKIEIIWEGKNKGKSLGRLEIFYIAQYNSFEDGYNMTKGGEGGFSWPKERFEELQELGKKIAKNRDNTYLKGKNNWMNRLSKEDLKIQVEKMLSVRDNTYLKGKNNPFCKLTPEKRMKIILKGNPKRRLYKASIETRRRMSKTRMKMYKGRNNPMSKKYKLFSPDNIEYFVQDGLENFCNKMNISLGMIGRSIKNNGKVLKLSKNGKSEKCINAIGWRAFQW